jgi:hypothetical protein
MQIATKLGGMGLSAPEPAPLLVLSLARMHGIAQELDPEFSLLLDLPPIPDGDPGPPDPAARLLPTVRAALTAFEATVGLPTNPTSDEIAAHAALSDFQSSQSLLATHGLLSMKHLSKPQFCTHTKILSRLQAERLTDGRPKLQRRLADISTDTARRFINMVPRYGLQELFFPDEMYADVARALLGICHRKVSPFNRCKCKGKPAFDADHAHRCDLITAKSIAVRHNAIADTLQRLCVKAGLYASKEPMANHSKASAVKSSHRGDLLIDITTKTGPSPADLTHSTKIDVAVVHAECSPAQSLEQSLRYRANAKVGKYGAMSAKQGWSFVPFVLSTMGTLAPQADDLLKTIARTAFTNGYTTNSNAFYVASVLSVLSCLHRHNTRIQEQGLMNLSFPIVSHTQAPAVQTN